MTRTTSRNAAPRLGQNVSSPTMVPNAIIGVAVAGFALLLAVGGGWWWWWWHQHRRGQNRATIISLSSRGAAQAGSGDCALSTRKLYTLTPGRDTLSESATSDATPMHPSSQSIVELHAPGVGRIKTSARRKDDESGLRNPHNQSLSPEHDARLEDVATHLRVQAMLSESAVLPIQSPILTRGPPSPIYTPRRTALQPRGENDPSSPITPLSPRPMRRQLTMVEISSGPTAEGKGVPSAPRSRRNAPGARVAAPRPANEDGSPRCSALTIPK